MKLFIKADGSRVIGMGHLSRMCALASELTKLFQIEFITRCDGFYLSGYDFIKCAGYSVKPDIVKTENYSDDLIIIDSYAITTDILNELKCRFKYVLVVDDNNILPFYNCDIILNQNYGAKSLDYKCPKNTLKLLGTEFLMLRNEFSTVNHIKINENVKNVLITMGGADSGNATQVILECLQSFFLHELKGITYHVVLGASNPNINKVKIFSEKFQNIIIHINPKMSEIMLTSDMAISACGSTVYELSAIGVPTIAVVTADNQINLYKRLCEDGLMVAGGFMDKFCKQGFINEFFDLFGSYKKRLEMSEKMNENVSGGGVKKICSILKSLGTLGLE